MTQDGGVIWSGLAFSFIRRAIGFPSLFFLFWSQLWASLDSFPKLPAAQISVQTWTEVSLLLVPSSTVTS